MNLINSIENYRCMKGIVLIRGTSDWLINIMAHNLRLESKGSCRNFLLKLEAWNLVWASTIPISRDQINRSDF